MFLIYDKEVTGDGKMINLNQLSRNKKSLINKTNLAIAKSFKKVMGFNIFPGCQALL